MRIFQLFFLALTVVFFTSFAMAQEMDIQWKDLSSAERQGILNKWRALPQGEKDPFVLYREQAIKELSIDKKKQYSKIAATRKTREEKVKESYKNQAMIENKGIKDIPSPVIQDISIPEVEPIAPIKTTPIETAKPAKIAVPAISKESVPDKKNDDAQSTTKKAQELINKYF